MPVVWWNNLFQKMFEHQIRTGEVTFSMEIPPSTLCRKKYQYLNGGIQPRRSGNGRKRIYHAKDYEALFKEILSDLPPVAGHKRIWMEAKRKGVPFGQGTCYRLLKELGLLAPRPRGRCRKKYESLVVDGPNEIYVMDTTEWYIGRVKYQIYAAIDACSRFLPALKAFYDKTSESTVNYLGVLLEQHMPASIHTDNGTEFANRRTNGYLESKRVIWKHGPAHTPQAQGLIERFNRTLKEEWLMWKEPKNIMELQKCLDEFREWYNRKRAHSSRISPGRPGL